MNFMTNQIIRRNKNIKYIYIYIYTTKNHVSCDVYVVYYDVFKHR